MSLLEFNNALMKCNAIGEAMCDAALKKQSVGDAAVNAAAGVTVAEVLTSVRKQGGPWLDAGSDCGNNLCRLGNVFANLGMYQATRFFKGEQPFYMTPKVGNSLMATNMLASMNQGSPFGFGGGCGMYNMNTTFPPTMYSPFASSLGGFWC